jgi:phenylpyruvate tautomerase PptA (4-oxalocrotonate tautomerase family)
MPLVHIDVLRGRDPQQLRTLLDTVHQAMVAAFDVPTTDRYQVLSQHDPSEIVALDTGLGYDRTEDIVIIRFTSRQRSQEAKSELYRRLAHDLHERCGIKPTDLIITITENGPADWSFGEGKAQFLSGDL